MNKYLEKIAGLQERVNEILNDYQDRHNEIEEPINDMHSDFDELESLGYQGGEEGSNDYYRDYLLDNMRRNRESELRRHLETDKKHQENHETTAKRLMALHQMEHLVTPDNAERIITKFRQVRNEHHYNGYKGLQQIHSMLGALGSGAGLGLLGARTGNMGLAMGGLAAGVIGGGYLGHKISGSIYGPKIEARNKEIYETREHRVGEAYDKLKHLYTPLK